MYQILMNIKGEMPVERFFDTKQDRDNFIENFEGSLRNRGITLSVKFEHAVFVSFDLKRAGESIGSLTVYR